jgi:hypothetical protein
MTESAPIISTGTSEEVARTVRTAGQTLTPALIVEGLRVFHLWQPEPAQLVWVLGAAPIILAFIQNKWEKAKGRRLIGAGTKTNVGDERGDWRFGSITGFVIVVLAVIGFFAVCNDDDANSEPASTPPPT